jgi:hypothetical protein
MGVKLYILPKSENFLTDLMKRHYSIKLDENPIFSANEMVVVIVEELPRMKARNYQPTDIKKLMDAMDKHQGI